MESYEKYKLVGSKLKLKTRVVPHKFECLKVNEMSEMTAVQHNQVKKPYQQNVQKSPSTTDMPEKVFVACKSISDDNARLSQGYQLCCCCLELVCLKSLWSEYLWMGRTEVYGDMLQECFSLTWPQSDKLQEQICEVCITQLRNAVQFKQKVMLCREKITTRLIDVVNTTMGMAEDVNNENNYDRTSDNEIIEDRLTVKSDGLSEDTAAALEDNYNKDSNVIMTVTRKKAGTKKSKRRKIYTPKNREKIDRRTLNYLKVRQNVCNILVHSTIVPFKSNKGYFNCLYCNMQHVGFDQLKTHVNQTHENISFKSISKCILRPHDRIRADVSDINCRICKKKIDNLEILIKHLTDDHSVAFNLDAVNPSDCILAYDLGDSKFRCYECKTEFLFFKTLSKHMNEHSNEHVCDVCGKCFLLPERLRAHTQLHSVGKTVKCEFCGKVCSSNIILRSHIRYTHKKLSFMCSICDKTFPSYRTRMRHLEEVHNRAPLNLTCKICSKSFSTPNSLNSHMRSDHLKTPKEPKHGCSICGMMFKSRHALSYHSIVHSNEKNYECDVCHKKYARGKTLTEHLKIHTNDRRWSCGACAQAFVQKCSLKNHIRVHHSDLECEQLIVYKKPDDK